MERMLIITTCAFTVQKSDTFFSVCVWGGGERGLEVKPKHLLGQHATIKKIIFFIYCAKKIFLITEKSIYNKPIQTNYNVEQNDTKNMKSTNVYNFIEYILLPNFKLLSFRVQYIVIYFLVRLNSLVFVILLIWLKVIQICKENCSIEFCLPLFLQAKSVQIHLAKIEEHLLEFEAKKLKTEVKLASCEK